MSLPAIRSELSPVWRRRSGPRRHTLHQHARRHEHRSETTPRPGNDRARSTGKKFSRTRSQASLGDERHLDRLPLNQARPGQSHHVGPTYLARDNGRRVWEHEHGRRRATECSSCITSSAGRVFGDARQFPCGLALTATFRLLRVSQARPAATLCGPRVRRPLWLAGAMAQPRHRLRGSPPVARDGSQGPSSGDIGSK
jgi:hypothetical protein